LATAGAIFGRTEASLVPFVALSGQQYVPKWN
jgi:hypothetical protein